MKITRIVCHVSGHRFSEFNGNFAKRKCERCDREEWLFSKPYPGIGEPKYFWKHMDWEKKF